MSFLSRLFGRKDEDNDADVDLGAALEQVEGEDEGLFMATGDQRAPAPEQPVTSPNQPPPDEFAPAEPVDAAEVQTAEPEAEATDPQPVEVGAELQPEAGLEATDQAIDDELAAEAAEGPAEDAAADLAAGSTEKTEELPEAESEGGAEEDSGDDDPLAAFRGAEKESTTGKLIEGMDDVSVQELLGTAKEVRDMLPAVGTNGSSEQPSE